jgi:hypothetical protein
MSQPVTARFGFAAFILAALIAAVAVAGVRLGWLAYAQGWQLMVPAVALELGALAFSLLWLGRALKANDGAGRGFGLTVLLGSLLLLYPPLTTVFNRLTSPPIHDVTTDTENPPPFVALLKQRGPGSNLPAYDGHAIVSFQGKTVTLDEVLHDHYRDILKPHAGFAVGSSDPIATFFRRDLAVARKTGWTIVDFNAQEGRIEATHTSFWFGRVSDIVILIRRSGAGARTDLRSQSREDKIDDGFNAANAKYFFSFLAS